MASSSSYNSPCAACKFLRRKCMPECIFSPYFSPEETQKFANVHKIFGASNVSKLLHEILPEQREEAVNSLAYEAEARIQDPVYGCSGVISFLQRRVQRLQKELAAANAELIRYACADVSSAVSAQSGGSIFSLRGSGGGGGGGYYQPSPFPLSHQLPWNYNSDTHGGGEGAQGSK